MSDNSQENRPCPVCEKTMKLKEYHNITICADCSKLATTLIDEQQRIARLDALLGESAKEQAEDLPDVLDARRYRTRDRENNSWYVSISEMEGQPVEIFASTAFDRDQHLQSRISNLTTITRLISLILRHTWKRPSTSYCAVHGNATTCPTCWPRFSETTPKRRKKQRPGPARPRDEGSAGRVNPSTRDKTRME